MYGDVHARANDVFGVVGRKKVTDPPKDEPLKPAAIGSGDGSFLVRVAALSLNDLHHPTIHPTIYLHILFIPFGVGTSNQDY